MNNLYVWNFTLGSFVDLTDKYAFMPLSFWNGLQVQDYGFNFKPKKAGGAESTPRRFAR